MAKKGAVESDEQVLNDFREGMAGWANAVQAHKMAPPDPGFAGRLAALAQGASRCCSGVLGGGRGGVRVATRPEGRQRATLRAPARHRPTRPPRAMAPVRSGDHQAEHRRGRREHARRRPRLRTARHNRPRTVKRSGCRRPGHHAAPSRQGPAFRLTSSRATAPCGTEQQSKHTVHFRRSWHAGARGLPGVTLAFSRGTTAAAALEPQPADAQRRPVPRRARPTRPRGYGAGWEGLPAPPSSRFVSAIDGRPTKFRFRRQERENDRGSDPFEVGGSRVSKGGLHRNTELFAFPEFSIMGPRRPDEDPLSRHRQCARQVLGRREKLLFADSSCGPETGRCEAPGCTGNVKEFFVDFFANVVRTNFAAASRPVDGYSEDRSLPPFSRTLLVGSTSVTDRALAVPDDDRARLRCWAARARFPAMRPTNEGRHFAAGNAAARGAQR